jgi:hypothetical protein
MIPNHTVQEMIKEVADARRILRTRIDGADAVTRILLATTVPSAREGLVKGAVLQGKGSLNGIDARLADTLEGYRVAARLSHPDPRWPTALAAGVLPSGHVYITMRWMPGTALHKLPDGLPYHQRVQIAVDVASLLAELHAQRVVFGDLKAENLVLGPDGQVSVIDLDTLREVVSATEPVITTDATPKWAAPEQNERHETFLASDLWSWANLLGALFPDGPPETWRGAVAACRARDPGRRPTAASLVAHLLDAAEPLRDATGTMIDAEQALAAAERADSDPMPPVEGPTDRVLDAAPINEITVRVADDGAPVAERTAERVAPVRSAARLGFRMPGCFGLLGIVGAGAIALCVGPIAWWDHTRVTEANRLADEALAAWKAHKTNASMNGRSKREELLALAEAAWEVRATPHAAATRALATVWARGWQDSGHKWKDEHWVADAAAVQAAEESGEPEAMLAEAVLYGARCRMRDTDPTVGAACTRARDASKRFHAALPAGAEHHWIRTEAAWTEVLVLGDLSHREEKAGLPSAADTLSEALDVCDRSTEWRTWAPVNGPELVQDCLRIAGRKGDFARYMTYAGELVDVDRGTKDGKLRPSTVEHIYTAWEGCADTTVRRVRKGADWMVKGDDWCLAIGAAARGCGALAKTYASLPALLRAGERPWGQISTLAASDDSTCAR